VGFPVGESPHHGEELGLTLEMFPWSVSESRKGLSPAVSTGRQALATRFVDQVVKMELKTSKSRASHGTCLIITKKKDGSLNILPYLELYHGAVE
jgi:hypothetical protein